VKVNPGQVDRRLPFIFMGVAIVVVAALFGGTWFAAAHFSDASLRWSVYGVAVMVATAMLVLWQIHIADEQTRLARIQTSIIQSQDEILNRMPCLNIRFEHNGNAADGSSHIPAMGTTEMWTLIPLEITNTGTRNVNEYAVDFLIPSYGEDNSITVRQESHPNSQRFQLEFIGAYTADMGNYMRWSKVVDDPVLAGATNDLPLLVLNIPPIAQTWNIRWRIRTGDYIFPSDGTFGTLLLITD
jgi:hypothetical protein